MCGDSPSKIARRYLDRVKYKPNGPSFGEHKAKQALSMPRFVFVPDDN